MPTNYSDPGVIAAFHILPDSSALVSASSIWSSRDFYIATPENSTWLFTSNSTDPELSGLGPEDVSDFWYQGNFSTVHGWIVYPEGFAPTSTYPLAFLIHGGPQSAWLNSWSTRWNLKVWADQGYIVVAINPTGSTSYGQAFTDAIQNNWGSFPYDDLVRGWQHINSSEEAYPYIDTGNGIAAGASYGGYMVNWIQGHDLGRAFRALVTHNGVTSTLNAYATEELWFMQRDFNGTLWENRDNYERYDPIAYASQFATPHFVVHSDRDYRLPVSEGVFLFNVLQELGVESRFLNFPDEGHWYVFTFSLDLFPSSLSMVIFKDSSSPLIHPLLSPCFPLISRLLARRIPSGARRQANRLILILILRVLNRENSRVWHAEIFRFINAYSGATAAAAAGST